MGWTAKELAAMAAADAEIEADFRLSLDDFALAREIDREAVMEARDRAARKAVAKQKAYREANREKLVDYQRFYRQRKKAEKEARDGHPSEPHQGV